MEGNTGADRAIEASLQPGTESSGFLGQSALPRPGKSLPTVATA